jgi:hypothetical protein
MSVGVLAAGWDLHQALPPVAAELDVALQAVVPVIYVTLFHFI